MSIFSTHYMIVSSVNPSKYWTGEPPENSMFWGPYENAVRFQTRASAENVLRGVLEFARDCKIAEDE